MPQNGDQSKIVYEYNTVIIMIVYKTVERIVSIISITLLVRKRIFALNFIYNKTNSPLASTLVYSRFNSPKPIETQRL